MVCSAQCSSGAHHQVECSILAILRTKIKRKKSGEKTWRESLVNISASVTTIRLLSLKWRDPPAWSLLTNLKGHQANESVWSLIATAFHSVLHLDPRIELEELRQVFCIQSTNGANLHLPTGYGRGVAVYPIQALLNHSCMCNTNTKDFPVDNKVEISARFDIRQGEELTTSYIKPTQATLARRQFLYHTWNFWCNCSRCADPTEGGANLAGLVCSTACGGMVLPISPLDNESDWACAQCGQTRTNTEAMQVLQQAVEEINLFPKENIQAIHLEEIIHRLGMLVSTSNWMLLEIQQKLLAVYMETHVVDRPTKERIVQLCRNILEYMDTVDPSTEHSVKRQMIRKCLVETRLEILTQEYKMGAVSKDILTKALKEKQSIMLKGSVSEK